VEMQNIKNWFNKLFNGGFDEKKQPLAFMAKVRMFNQVNLTGFFTLVILGISAFIKGYIIIAVTDFLISLFLLFIIYYLRISQKYKILSFISVIVFGVFIFYLLVSGGVGNTGYLWAYTFPLIAFYLTDSKKGSFVTFTFFLFSLFYFVFQSSFTMFAQYSNNIITRFIASFTVVFFLSYIFEKMRERTYCIVTSKNEELNKTIEKLERNEKELKRLHDELEKRVIERTAELKTVNEKLLSEIKLKNQAMKTAEAAIKMKTEFLAQMSHEIRTPVNSILSYTQLLKDETIDIIPEDLRFSFDMINNGGRRLIRTIDLILNVSELQTGTYEPIMEKSNIIEDIIEPLIGEFQTAAKAKNLDLNFVNLLNEKKYIYTVDIYTITQIIANLIDNAIKYTKKGTVEVIAYKNKNDLFSIDIKDSGIGISEEFQKTLFEPFTQEEQGYCRKFEGNGLGMALVKEYCKINNLKISVASKKNIGTTFTLTFPENKY
jgi:signal transduction histidine kinase